MGLGGGSILAARLHSNAASCVISLVLVVFLYGSLRTRCLRQRPSGHVLLRRRIRRCLGHVPAGSDGARGGDQVLEALSTTSVTECVLWLVLELWLVNDHVLRTRVGVVVSTVHTGLSTNLGGTDTGSSVVVSLDGVIQE